MSSTHPMPISDLSTQASAGQGGEPDRTWLDRVGITASVACAIHCMLAPFLMLLLPAAGSIWAHPAVHWVLAVLVLPLAVWVIYKGYLKHRKRWTLAAAWLGSACIVAGLIAPMVSTQPLMTFQVPSFGLDAAMLGSAQTAGASGACTEACCPTLRHDASTGAFRLAMPPGGLVTMVGSVLLVFAHLTNLLACRCLSRKAGAAGCGESACGCTA